MTELYTQTQKLYWFSYRISMGKGKKYILVPKMWSHSASGPQFLIPMLPLRLHWLLTSTGVGRRYCAMVAKNGSFTEWELCADCDVWMTSQKRSIHFLQYLIIHMNCEDTTNNLTAII